MRDEPRSEPVDREELARLYAIEAAAEGIMSAWDAGGRSATPMLAAIAVLRAALRR
jgi:hypothetical protein